MSNTWVILLRNTDFAVPSLQVFAHNLTHEAAKSQADEINKQRVEGEPVTLVDIMDGHEPHEGAYPEECGACHDLILAAHREELAALRQALDKRGFWDSR
jgi:hypothetical protein